MSPTPHATRPEALAAEAGSDGHWKALTQRANEARQTGKAGLARTVYEAALQEAERLFEAAGRAALPDGARLAPMLYNISCHNLAEHLAEQGDGDGALALLQRAFDRLVQSATDDGSPLDVRASCARHLQVAAAPLVECLVERGAREQAEALVQRANLAIAAVIGLARGPASHQV